jgi:pimeloyl-ACP methyl ester carboxylesterase
MSRRRINGFDLYYERQGDGEAVVLVHGSWTDHVSWTFVVDDLAQTNHVVTYDRRGHSRSERGAAAVPRRVDEDDLVALIESLGLGPVHLVGNSYGASISLGVAARRPDLVRSVTAHEPPLIGIATPGSALATELGPVVAALETVAAAVGRGNAEAAAEQFVEEVALGPGSWQLLPLENRQTMVANAPMIIDVVDDPHSSEPPRLAEIAAPVLLTDGAASPPWLPAIVEALAATADVARHTFAGAGHVPHLTHPAEHVAVARSFIESTSPVTA